MNAAERIIISTPNAPKAIGPYAQAVQYGDLMFVSGMIPLDPETGELVTGTFEVEVVSACHRKYQGHRGSGRHVPEECPQINRLPERPW